MKYAFLVLLLCMVPAHADYLVLKNGKKLKIKDSYEIKDQYVVFYTADGDLGQLPVNLVDFEASKQYTEEREAQDAAEAQKKVDDANTQKAKPETLSEFVDRSGGNKRKKPVSLDDKKIKRYASENPQTNDKQASATDLIDILGSKIINVMSDLNINPSKQSAQYQDIKQDLMLLTDKLRELKSNYEGLAKDVASGNADASYDPRMRELKKKMEEVGEKIKEKLDSLNIEDSTDEDQ